MIGGAQATGPMRGRIFDPSDYLEDQESVKKRIAKIIQRQQLVPSPALRRAEVAAACEELARGDSAFAKGGAATLWVLGEIGAGKARKLKGHEDLYYLERCAKYVEEIEGAPGYRGCLTAWHAVLDLIGWQEVPAKVAAAMGAKLRKLQKHERWGRHMILTRGQLQLLAIGWDAAKKTMDWKEPPPRFEWIRRLGRVPMPGVSTKVRCICEDHEDRNPSMIAVRDKKDKNGGRYGSAWCASCEKAAAVRFVRDRRGWVIELRETFEDLGIVKGAPKVDNEYSAHTSETACEADTGAAPRFPSLNKGIASSWARGEVIGASLKPVKGTNCAETYRTDGHRLKGSLPEVLRNADRMSRGPAARAKAEEKERAASMFTQEELKELHPERWMPMLMITGSRVAPVGWRDLPLQDRMQRIPCRWKAVAQEWLIFDLDKIAPPMGDVEDGGYADRALEEALREVGDLAALEDGLSGAVIMDRSGDRGVHVYLELSAIRLHPQGWYADPDVRARLESLGAQIIGIVRSKGWRGGHVCPLASYGPGRWFRKPSWRLLKNGRAFRCRLIGMVGVETK